MGDAQQSNNVQKSKARPNVIVFFTDQQRWDTAGCYGNPLGLTPNLDRMAWKGTHVAEAFTCQPVCGPARSCLQTGLYATASGCFTNGIPLPEGTRTLADCFNDAGYDTAYIGKWHLASTRTEPVPEERRGGYRYWLAADSLEHTSDAYRTLLYNADNEPVKLPGYRVDALTDAAIRYVADGRPEEKPFFLFLSFLEPHHQNHRDDYPSPDVYKGKYAGGQYVPPDLAALGGTAHQHLDGYYGMVKRLDEALGRLMDALKSLDLLDNTVIAFTSDHGCHFKTRNSEYKRSCHESSIRVPLVFSGPGFDGGGSARELVSLIDLPPTLLDAAGIAVPEQMQGRSLLRQLRHRHEGRDNSVWPEEVFVQISESQVARAIRTRRWKYGVHAPERNPLRYPGAMQYMEQYLYDLEADPYELTNLVQLESHEEVRERLRERLIRRMNEAGEATPDIVPMLPVSSGQRRVLPGELEQ
ncbi:sulfatase-like hydrolase/transferase [Paenibacillus rigui]|uniref:Arylsulfatase n=1 Tax=Paenibacillus rigui TaxID=554312 RepID=A0A229UI44_9BACL|nr:sulfatase-like hydrolase/transferase [Paenibacillus rigui]OXM82965.1 arylsulfatase [Paenibacillus rigui]